uniref:RNA polymerase II C-terminal domain phosphatase-like n=1 Tax=Kalanchoe fedtschenkoi TaxID=63787 RepID=A0A7N1A489_KALFE
MSVVTDSPVHSSSSDDFAAFLDGELDSVSDEEHEIESVKRRKVESSGYVEEIQESVSVTSVGRGSGKSREKDKCSHPGVFSQMCYACGEKIEEDSGVTLRYIHKELRLGSDELARLRTKDVKNLLRHRKLYMILDLDHTLLNSTGITDVAPDEEYLRNPPNYMEGSLFVVPKMPIMTKLRPFVRDFLKQASSMFEMYIYTMGDSHYAAAMASLLDPKKEYFDARVISRDESTQKHQKGLDLVLGQESAVVILDDTETVWSRHMDNLILIERYNFFASSCRQHKIPCKSLAELRTDESESDGILATVLQVLKRIHCAFFKDLGDDPADRDVRQVLRSERSEILKGCKIVFSRVFSLYVQAETHILWRIAEGLGATCCTEVDPSVTHVVAADAGTEKARWAVKENKFLVNQQWIEAANFLWKRQPEDNFPVKPPKNT